MSEMTKKIAPGLFVVMGVSGCGKTTVAEGLAAHFGWPFQEGDDLHPRANVEKMHSGTPLDDADRAPWLQICHEWLRMHEATGGVLTCSALKRKYRDTLRQGLKVTFVYLETSELTIAERLKHRLGHFMPPSLLPSQLATLEPPGSDENVVVVDSAGTPEIVMAELIKEIEARAI
ncbi:gluconokinase [Asaia lannensis]|uniref:Gluconokinase n=1 Tax=Asaia lannensis NBRC 102526 TaxID=1307926 RepID=A0ABT1CEB3_9PROT|nr:gluconokinase [Asaia lannensis]MCO6159197.1 gluconokinase [Asaia lannensis NBRC 102526]GBQ97139.1 gluconokinase [Asaia lannensis NBRC 102526]